jgi:hypothetical protein
MNDNYRGVVIMVMVMMMTAVMVIGLRHCAYRKQ